MTALSGMAASTKRIETGAANIASAGTSGALAPENGPAPYAAQTVQQTSGAQGTVTAQAVPKDPAIVQAYDPDSPFADADGTVGVPNVNLAEEIVGMKRAEHAYKAALKTIETASEMQETLLKAFDS